MPLKMPLGMEAVPDMTYNVFSGTLNPTQSINLGMEVGLGPGDFVFDGDPVIPRKKGTPTPPNFWLMSIGAKRLDGSRYATWYGGKPRPRRRCVRWIRSSPLKGAHPPVFGLFIAAKRLGG